MEILIAVGAAVLAGAVAWTARGRARALQPAHDGKLETPPRRERGGHPEGGTRAHAAPAVAAPAGQPGPDTAEELARLRERLEQELAGRRAEIARLEDRILHREESLDRRLGEADARERSLNDRELAVERLAEDLERASDEHLRALEQIAGMSRGQAKVALTQELEAEARHDVARTVRGSRRRLGGTPLAAREASFRLPCSGSPRAMPQKRRSRSSSFPRTT